MNDDTAERVEGTPPSGGRDDTAMSYPVRARAKVRIKSGSDFKKRRFSLLPSTHRIFRDAPMGASFRARLTYRPTGGSIVASASKNKAGYVYGHASLPNDWPMRAVDGQKTLANDEDYDIEIWPHDHPDAPAMADASETVAAERAAPAETERRDAA